MQATEWTVAAQLIQKAWEQRHESGPDQSAIESIHRVLEALDAGILRAAERKGPGDWIAFPWVMNAVILSFASTPRQLTRIGNQITFDQPGKLARMSDDQLRQSSWRVVSWADVRYGVFLGERVFLMPSFVSTGAWIGSDTMIDGLANVGTCAQIGCRVHISAGVSIGGIAEPLQSQPVIIEDDCFIGANCSIVEGVIVEEGSVVGPGVHLTGSTKILDRSTGKVSFGRIPSGSVVVSGTMPSACATHQLACAVIVKRVDAKTRAKVGITAVMRA